MNDLHSVREAKSAYEPYGATERVIARECKSRVTLLLRDADSGQIDPSPPMGLTTHAAAQAG